MVLSIDYLAYCIIAISIYSFNCVVYITVLVHYKHSDTIVKALNEYWCMDLGFPIVGFGFDNGGECWNLKILLTNWD